MDVSRIRQVFLLILGLTYIGLGFFIFLKKIIETPWGEILGLLFASYGLWRVYRSLQKN